MGFKIKEITGDLFQCPPHSSMAHCVSTDLHMGKGIAVMFKSKFGRLNELKAQNAKTGGVAVLKDKERYIYYLITKDTFYRKPTYQSLSESLNSMRSHMIENEVQSLSIPRIGCGLDGLMWGKVKDVITETFENDEIEITVYNYSPK